MVYSNFKYFSLTVFFIFLILFSKTEPNRAQIYAEAGFMDIDSSSIMSFSDGPHVEWKDSKRYDAMFLKYNDSLDIVTASIIPGRLKKGSKYLIGTNIDSRKFRVTAGIEPSPAIINTDKDIFVMGDVHGEYTRLLKLLRISGIINSSNNWIWGEGHLVFLGDLMDRGAYVTETLWFVKKLQYQANKSGGAVHLILGNHEIMNLTGDHRYINKKYLLLCEKLNIDYFNFYTENMELGRWIRSMNTMIRINDNLFVHGGISPELIDMKLPIDTVNTYIQKYLKREFSPDTRETMFFLTDNKGPFWYRGLLYPTPQYPKLKEEELDNILEFYDASRIIFGHSENRLFQISKDKRLMGIDVPLRLDLDTEHALLIQGEKFYKVFSNGSKELIE